MSPFGFGAACFLQPARALCGGPDQPDHGIDDDGSNDGVFSSCNGFDAAQRRKAPADNF
jgi:hypothetical protein